MSGVPFSELPPTFMDAVTTTQELGIDHIWIDSLCIIQDDPKDWQQEAANMAAIYESAELTIAATWGIDSRSGCFHDYIQPFAINLRVEDVSDSAVDQGLECNLVIRLLGQSWYHGDDTLPSVTPLSTRKWTLQEEVLSARIISFSENQMQWSCAGGSRTEDAISSRSSTTNPLALMRQTSTLEATDLAQCLKESWKHVVDEYSKRRITFAGDKIAAIAGMTRVFAEVSGEVDILGMWKRYLTSNLLWSSGGMHCKIDTPAVQSLRIPTWSWLASAHQVEMPFAIPRSDIPGDNEGSLIEITDALVEWNGVPMTSKIRRARIVILGLLLPIFNVQQSPNSSMNARSMATLPLGDCMCFSSRVSVRLPSGELLKLLTGGWQLDECRRKFEGQTYCLLFSYGEWDTRDKYDRMRYSGLPLTRLSTMIVAHADATERGSKYIRLGLTSLGGFPLDRLKDLQLQHIELV